MNDEVAVKVLESAENLIHDALKRKVASSLKCCSSGQVRTARKARGFKAIFLSTLNVAFFK